MNSLPGLRFTLGAAVCVAAGCLASAAFGDEAPSAKRPPWTTSRIHGAPQAPAPFRLAAAFPKLKFQKPTSIEELPGTQRLLVTEMDGRIVSFPKDGSVGEADLVADLRALLPKELAGRPVSLYDAEPHPGYAANRYLFVCYVHPADGQTRVSRFTLSEAAAPRIVAGTEKFVIAWPSGGHMGGCLEFGKDGCLYIATGDGTGPNPPDALTTGQDVSDLLGAVLRIDVDRAGSDRGYSVPSDNPFVDLPEARPEIWAYGLRNPWKFGVDPETGDVFAADNGWESWEMVHRIVRGGNCGWPVMEGRAALRTDVKVGPTPIIPPVKDHPHSEANSVIGGPVYRGQKLPNLHGSFIYGDYITGTIWAIKPDRDNSYSHTTLVDTDQQIIAFTEGSEGEIYVLDYDFTGQIYELLPSGLKDTSATFPRRLSETGLFASLETLEPAAGVFPYDVQVPRWMDGAAGRRWIAIPGSGAVRLASLSEAPAEYPEGTVLVKQVSLPGGEGGTPVRLETQILHYEAGAWRPYSYLWDEAGRDADLVGPLGASRPVRLADPAKQGGVVERTWRVSAVNECKLCHNAGARFVLGFTPNQLNRNVAAGSAISEQLKSLAAQNVLAAAPAIADDDPARLVDPHDRSQKLEDRARSYLHANCAMCHHPGGNAIVSFYLRRDLPPEKLNTNKGTGIGTFGISDAKIIAPGDPFRSLLMYRTSKLGYARMPYIGSQVVDSAGVALVEEWIRSLPRDSGESSAPLTSGSAEDTALKQLVDKSGSQEDRAGAVRRLVQSTEGALALAGQLHRGSLADAEREAAVAIGVASSSSDIRGLFETFIPESQRRATLGPNADPQVILALDGDRERGKLIFFSDGARCRACHEIDDRDASLGPTIQEINKKYPRLAEMLEHALQPSLKIDDPYAAYTVVTNDGRVIAGLLVEQTDREVVIRTAEKQTIRIARDRIDEIRKSDQSLMPERILSDLTAQEAADLLEYLRSHGPAP
jgi:putative heme-binding domain-containing protein